MITRRPKKQLAYQVGLCRIALVVDGVHRQMKTHPTFVGIFESRGDEGQQRARLTYFWWVVLGGNKLRDMDWEVIAEFARAATSPELLEDWLAMFQGAALPIIGEELAHAWTQRVEDMADEFLSCEESDASLALAS
jgi:truncated hemoglobin YjbI